MAGYVIKYKLPEYFSTPKPSYYVYKKGWFFETFIDSYQTLQEAEERVASDAGFQPRSYWYDKYGKSTEW